MKDQIREADDRRRSRALSLLRSEDALAEAIADAEALLAQPSLLASVADPSDVARYAMRIRSTTSAPPEWRSWRPVLAQDRVLEPYPTLLPYLSPPGPNGRPFAFPSLAHATWPKLRPIDVTSVSQLQSSSTAAAGRLPVVQGPGTLQGEKQKFGSSVNASNEQPPRESVKRVAEQPPHDSLKRAALPAPLSNENPSTQAKPAVRVVAGLLDDDDDDD